MSKILQKDEPVLRQIARPVEPGEIGTAALNEILAQMSLALAEQGDGVALAAPQIGVSKRIFVVSRKVFGEEEKVDRVFINPKLTKVSKKKELVEEGCLSVRGLYGQMQRATKVSVEAQNELGKKFVHHGSGLLAQIFQHESDHLDGVLFTDTATNLHQAEVVEEKS